MNIQGVKSPDKRLEVTELSSLLVRAYGVDNLYPQSIAAMIAASNTATLCVRRAARFIEGKGFADTAIYDYVLNRSDETMDDLLKVVARDLARFDGFALHINYNAMAQPIECSHVPFENCRLGFDDSVGYTGRIAVHPDWSGKKKRQGKVLKVSIDTIDYIDIFNPTPSIIYAQIEKAGGIESYKGQILYVSSSGRNVYPEPRADAIVTDMSTDEGLGNIRLRNTRNNYLPAGMLIKPKGNSDQEDEDFAKAFAAFQGDTTSNNIISVTYDGQGDEVKPTFVPFDSKNYDKEFDTTTKTTVENIYAAYEQEKFFRIRSGSLGFSSDIAADVMEDYSDTLSSEQRMIERAFSSVFKNWEKHISDDFSIIPLKKERNVTPDKK